MADPAAIADIMNRMWEKFLPDIGDRVRVLENAAEALAQGSISAELRAEAFSAAHKLAGTLGTFGLEEGTVLAREAEAFYSTDASVTASNGRPAIIASRLRTMLAARGK
ncbi:MAG TPA: Hpt domain-containing protein [Terracidiphilus sp.]|jgi:HPt (histidine-containing phosphotransfer) domain-containing protein|nr:Hpt domain-containing protein [Terracidiphilus sp.]